MSVPPRPASAGTSVARATPQASQGTSRHAARRRSVGDAGDGAARARARVRLRQLADARASRRIAAAATAHVAAGRAEVRPAADVVAGRGTDVWALFQACAAGDLADRAGADRERPLAGAGPLRLPQAALFRRAREPRRRRAISARARFQPDGPLGGRRPDRDRARSRLCRDGAAAGGHARNEVQRVDARASRSRWRCGNTT